MIRSYGDWEWRGYRQVDANVDLFIHQPEWMEDPSPRDQVLRIIDVEAFALTEMWAGIALISEIEVRTVTDGGAAEITENIGLALRGGYRREDIDRIVTRACATGHLYVTMTQSYGGSFQAICRSIESDLPISIAA